jgi:hypothetical protein
MFQYFVMGVLLVSCGIALRYYTHRGTLLTLIYIVVSLLTTIALLNRVLPYRSFAEAGVFVLAAAALVLLGYHAKMPVFGPSA